MAFQDHVRKVTVPGHREINLRMTFLYTPRGENEIVPEDCVGLEAIPKSWHLHDVISGHVLAHNRRLALPGNQTIRTPMGRPQSG